MPASETSPRPQHCSLAGSEPPVRASASLGSQQGTGLRHLGARLDRREKARERSQTQPPAEAAEAAGRTESEIRARRPAALPHSRQSLSLASGEADSWGAAGCGAEAAGVWLSAHSSSCPRPAPRNCFHSRRAATSGSDTQDGGWGFPRDFLRKPVKVGCRLRGPGTLAN